MPARPVGMPPGFDRSAATTAGNNCLVDTIGTFIAPLNGPHRRKQEAKRAVLMRAALAKPPASLPFSPAFLNFDKGTVEAIVRAHGKDPVQYTFHCHSEGHLHTKIVGSGATVHRLWHCWGGTHFEPLHPNP